MQSRRFRIDYGPTELGHLGHRRHRKINTSGAGCQQCSQRSIHGLTDLIGRDIKEIIGRHADAQILDTLMDGASVVGDRSQTRIGIDTVTACHHLQDLGEIPGRSGHRTDHINRGRELHAARAWNQSVRRLETDEPIGRSWDTHGAARIRAETRISRAAGHRSTRTARRAAGNMLRVPSIATIAVGGIVPGCTEREFRHVERTHFECAGLFQTGGRGSNLLRSVIEYGFRTVAH